jgi:hypothetical protein
VTKPTDWKGQPIPAAPGKSLVAALKADVNVERPSLWVAARREQGHPRRRLQTRRRQGRCLGPVRLSTDRAEQLDLSAKMPDKAKELADLWQKQTDEYVTLAKLTLAEQPKGKAGKNNAKKKAK